MKATKKLIALLLCLATILIFSACGTGEGDTDTDAISKSESVSHPIVEVTIKDFGKFKLELYPEYAPATVTNFIELVYDGFYEGSTFHRVVDGFMAQGGQSATGKTVDPIKGEFKSNGYEKNTISHERGVISMARTSDKNSATSQFFICYTDSCKSLDGDYAAFGKVIEGMEIVDKFTEVERTANSLGEIAVPVEDIVIEKMEVVGT